MSYIIYGIFTKKFTPIKYFYVKNRFLPFIAFFYKIDIKQKRYARQNTKNNTMNEIIQIQNLRGKSVGVINLYQ